ncbi:MAG: hypothetical protein ABSE07_07065 [Methanoregula sp.]|jgi:hypothetical protein
MSENLPTVIESEEITGQIDTFSSSLGAYLVSLNLPNERVLVEIKERRIVIGNMAIIIDHLNPDQCQRALYISKFIASCGAGLFDSALNYLWNETIVNLRSKVIRFDLDYFFDSTIGNSKKRIDFKTEKDLEKLDDWELIRGCRETGIISDIGYKHLDYIRDMRNFASAAHPNHRQITGLQLLSWLETCIIEVLAKEPEGPVLEIRKLLQNIRTQELTKNDAIPIIANIERMPQDLTHSLLRALFGMYVDERQDVFVRENIELFGIDVWNNSDNAAKNDIAFKYAVFSANAELAKKELAKQFLSIVDGLGYISDDQRAIEIREVCETLLHAHNGFNNFYNEEPHAKTLIKYIPPTGSVPQLIRSYYVKVILICKLGNRFGIALSAEPYYIQMIDKFQDAEFIELLKLLDDNEIVTIFNDPIRANRFVNLLVPLKDKIKSEKLKKAFDIVLNGSIPDLQSKKTYQTIKNLL